MDLDQDQDPSLTIFFLKLPRPPTHLFGLCLQIDLFFICSLPLSVTSKMMYGNQSNFISFSVRLFRAEFSFILKYSTLWSYHSIFIPNFNSIIWLLSDISTTVFRFVEMFTSAGNMFLLPVTLKETRYVEISKSYLTFNWLLSETWFTLDWLLKDSIKNII